VCFFTGGQCGCSDYSTLLYALSSAVALLILLLAFVAIYKVSGPAACIEMHRSDRTPRVRGEGEGVEQHLPVENVPEFL